MQEVNKVLMTLRKERGKELEGKKEKRIWFWMLHGPIQEQRPRKRWGESGLSHMKCHLSSGRRNMGQ